MVKVAGAIALSLAVLPIAAVGATAHPAVDVTNIQQVLAADDDDLPIPAEDTDTTPPAGEAADAPDHINGKVDAAAAKPSRDEAINRGRVWLTANGGKPVPYSQSKNWKDGYRQDCSGFVSMAWKIKAPGLNTVGLKGVTTPITKAQLLKGDALLDANGTSNTRHVVLFVKWADAAKTKYVALEQRGGAGTSYRTISYPYPSTPSEYKPVRYL
ncbi:cell wall-associated hydrolase [Pseudonocardiaceae bacterium YIM PH 21723]|nr:cell wall-associated hydrolase [Pseudonocardiaceae bacterium YIM PH 21723]